jgi:hypothetical protein
MRYQAGCRFAWVLTLVGAGIAGCGGDNDVTSPATSGTLEIRTSTTGVEMDADGYAVQVDGGTAQAIGVAATIQSTEVAPGVHAVQLTGMAANCALAGENPRTATVAAGETATVSLEITCSASTGGLQVTATTSGSSPDADGYSVTVDGTERGAMGASAAVTVDGLTAGAHEIGLTGIAGNCRVQGDNPQTVTVSPGGSASVAFTVTCDAPPPNPGTIRIATVTTGPSPDPNGYRFLLDGGTAQTIGVSASATLTNVAAGNHSIRINGLAPNCKVQGTNPRSVSVTSGATAEVSFAIECGAATGSVEVRSTTTGTPDPDGYTVSVDGGAPQAIGANATLVIPGVATGSRRVLLDGLAPGCAIPGENPQQVTVIVNATASVQFAVTCGGPTGGGPSWTRMNSGTTLTLEAVSGSSGTNVFAAGETNGQMTIVHYDGTSWIPQLTHDGGVADIWAASTTDGFALVTGAGFTGPVLRYNGQQWTSMSAQPPPPGLSENEEPSLSALWGSSSNDVWAVGGAFIDIGEWHEYIVHFDGTQWSLIPPRDRLSYITLLDVWGSSSTDIYAVGGYDPWDDPPEANRAVILHYDGQAWTEVFRAPNSNLTLKKIWGLSRSDVYAVGYEGDRAAILHFDGQAWSAMPSPVALESRGIWGSAPTDLYALPGPNRPTERPGVIWHWDGSNWIDEPTGVEDGLLDIWGSSATDIFVVGGNGTILHGP